MTAKPGGMRKYANVFDGVAEAYDAARPSYPPELVDAAIAAGGLDAESRILEIGAGTGKLTEMLVERGLRIHAVEPGVNLIEAARRRIGDTPAVEFEIATFEDAALADHRYDAVFSATAFHWVDPAVGWPKVARALAPGGLFALLTHVAVEDSDERALAMERELIAILARYVPDVAEAWKLPLPLTAMTAGVSERSGNVSDAWDWIMGFGRHDLARPEAARLFDDVRAESHAQHLEQTADEVLAQWRTTSLYFMVEEDRRSAFEDDYRALIERNGGTFPFVDCTFLLTARSATAARRD
jgi:SAM-dependent methyltransferase